MQMKPASILYLGGSIMENVNNFIEQNIFLQNLYDVIRIIEPIANKEVLFVNGKEPKLKDSCYKFWKKSKRCNNCVTMRAYFDKRTYVKIEYNKEKIFLVTATPANIGSEDYVIELLKDITESGIIENIDKRTQEDVGGAIQGMNNLVVKDELTGVFNRRFINERLPAALHSSKLNNKPLSVMMLDIDHFKLINDKYGHLAGDAVLVQFSKLLKNRVESEIGWVARYGGDEFLILLNGISADDAFNIAKDLREQICENTFIYKDNIIEVRVSIGVYFCDDSKITPEEVINNVDKKLYLAKEKGRNRAQA